MHNRLTRVVAPGALSLLLAGASAINTNAADAAAKANTSDFVAACSADENVTQEPGFEDGKLDENKATQKDVDMMTKMHKDDISDADAAAYPTLDDLMNTNEGFEDACRTALGLPAVDDEEPSEEDTVPDEGAPDDKNSPPE